MSIPHFPMIFIQKVKPIKLLILMGRGTAGVQEKPNIKIDLKHRLLEEQNTDENGDGAEDSYTNI